MDIDGITAIVTGSGRAIGRAIARELARNGARVVCCSRTEAELAETVQLITSDGGTATGLPTDVTDRDQVLKLVDHATEFFGDVDLLVNNAASFRAVGAAWEVDIDRWWKDIETNLLGSFLCCHAVLPRMMERNRGIIINMTGGGASSPMLGGGAYGSSKAALMRVTDTLAAELGDDYAIQVFGLDPGFVRSGISEHVAETPGGQRWLPYVKKDLEAGRDHPADDVGAAVANLVRIATPDLSGRIFSFADDFDSIARRATEIRQNDLRQLRVKSA